MISLSRPTLLTSVATVLAVIAVFILAGAVLVFVVEGMDKLSSRNQCALLLLTFYVVCFWLYEVSARERRRKHFQLGEMNASDWVRRFKQITPQTDPTTLQALYDEGIMLRNEFGNLTHPDFKRDLEALFELLRGCPNNHQE